MQLNYKRKLQVDQAVIVKNRKYLRAARTIV